MRFSLTVAMCGPDELIPMARAAEAAGWDGVAVPDSVFYPQQVSADYPYTADGSRFWDESTPFVDPFVAVPAMAAATTNLRFVTNVVKLPLRHPLLVAKTLTSVEAMFPGRLALGVGLSWIPEEFSWLGIAKSTRGARLDESIDAIRAHVRTGWSEYHGKIFDEGPLTMSPAPEGPPPILVGGHSEPALRRAAAKGDGWVSAMVSAAEVADFIAKLTALRAEAGRGDEAFEYVVTPTLGPDPDAFASVARSGATESIVAPWFYYGARDLAGKIASIERFAADVIAPTRDRLAG